MAPFLNTTFKALVAGTFLAVGFLFIVLFWVFVIPGMAWSLLLKGRNGPLLAVIHAIAIVVLWRVFLHQWVLLDFRVVVDGSLKDFALGLFNMVSGYVLFVTGFRAPIVLRAVLLPDQPESTGQ
ncbi:MAG: hypothetical protein JW706_06255 [Opitutales bacterium]|nr:hypothetical protein [Opitutales bacterium]